MDQELKQEFENLGRMIKDGFDQGATKEELEELENKMEGLEKRMATKEDLAHVENQMVTKDYLDKKLGEHHGNLVILMRKEDTKVLRLVEILKEKNILSEDEVKEILSMEPFPKLAL